jgi:hypothetical protein
MRAPGICMVLKVVGVSCLFGGLVLLTGCVGMALGFHRFLLPAFVGGLSCVLIAVLSLSLERIVYYLWLISEHTRKQVRSSDWTGDGSEEPIASVR